ncbi:hypothetical protein LJC08_01625 [Methanimicrococcus sp. OttesenSCG-928-J09]|nr:hypothetical protein [Methanimicrococcus sp. OttesenSCG-928-J09]
MAFLDIAEAYFKLDKIDLANQCLKKVFPILKKMNKNEKSITFLNISEMFQRIHDYENEYKHLDKILKKYTLDDFVLTKKTIERFNNLELSQKYYDFHQLEKIDKNNLAKEYVRVGGGHIKKFQFELAIPYFERANEITNSMIGT